MVFNLGIKKDKSVSLYDNLPLNILAGFYYHIFTNIEKGILSSAMNHEINLIKQAADKRGVPLWYLYNQGSLMK